MLSGEVLKGGDVLFDHAKRQRPPHPRREVGRSDRTGTRTRPPAGHRPQGRLARSATSAFPRPLGVFRLGVPHSPSGCRYQAGHPQGLISVFITASRFSSLSSTAATWS
jgi:hypothetical protein